MVKYEGVKTVKRYGKSYVITLDPEIREMLSLEAGDYVTITMERKADSDRKQPRA